MSNMFLVLCPRDDLKKYAANNVNPSKQELIAERGNIYYFNDLDKLLKIANDVSVRYTRIQCYYENSDIDKLRCLFLSSMNHKSIAIDLVNVLTENGNLRSEVSSFDKNNVIMYDRDSDDDMYED
mgnify:CR=1 FL=1